MNCLFCKIVNKEIPSETVYEDKNFLAFEDIHPIAPLHVLIIPKKHIPALDRVGLRDKELIGEMFFVSKKVAESRGVAGTGYRLIFNVGEDAGQTVDHLHLHLLGGKKLSWK